MINLSNLIRPFGACTCNIIGNRVPTSRSSTYTRRNSDTSALEDIILNYYKIKFSGFYEGMNFHSVFCFELLTTRLYTTICMFLPNYLFYVAHFEETFLHLLNHALLYFLNKAIFFRNYWVHQYFNSTSVGPKSVSSSAFYIIIYEFKCTPYCFQWNKRI